MICFAYNTLYERQILFTKSYFCHHGSFKIWSVNVDNTSGIVCTMDYRGEGELSVDSNRLVLISLVY